MKSPGSGKIFELSKIVPFTMKELILIDKVSPSRIVSYYSKVKHWFTGSEGMRKDPALKVPIH